MADNEPILPPSGYEESSRNPVSSDDPRPKPGLPQALKIPSKPHPSVFRYANTHPRRKVNPNAWWRIILRILSSHVGLSFLVSLYAMGGAYIFIAIEKPLEDELFEQRKVRYLEMNDSINYISGLLWFHSGHDKMSIAKWNDLVWKHVKKLEHFIIDSVDDLGYDGAPDGWDNDWGFYNTLLFTMSIMSTTGYGQLHPYSNTGRVFCIIYAMFGIPLMLIFLANIGDFLARSLRYTYSRWCCHWCRVNRKKSEYRREDRYLPVPRQVLRSVDQEKVGQEAYMPTDDIDVPIILILVFLTAYVIAGAYLFSHWEDWEVVDAAYFTFITITTIGYGDMVPGKSFSSSDDDEVNPDDHLNNMVRLFGACLYCAFGLALLSMSISLMQEQVSKKLRNIAKNIGLIKEK